MGLNKEGALYRPLEIEAIPKQTVFLGGLADLAQNMSRFDIWNPEFEQLPNIDVFKKFLTEISRQRILMMGSNVLMPNWMRLPKNLLGITTAYAGSDAYPMTIHWHNGKPTIIHPGGYQGIDQTRTYVKNHLSSGGQGVRTEPSPIHNYTPEPDFYGVTMQEINTGGNPFEVRVIHMPQDKRDPFPYMCTRQSHDSQATASQAPWGNLTDHTTRHLLAQQTTQLDSAGAQAAILAIWGDRFNDIMSIYNACRMTPTLGMRGFDFLLGTDGSFVPTESHERCDLPNDARIGLGNKLTTLNKGHMIMPATGTNMSATYVTLYLDSINKQSGKDRYLAVSKNITALESGRLSKFPADKIKAYTNALG